MKKPFLLLGFLILLGSLTFADTGEQEEVDFLLFSPNSSNQFVNEAQAKIQLDSLAKYLMGKTLTPGQIHVLGYAAAAANNIEPVNLSKNRALFVISELQKRGIAKDLFSDPVGYGSVDLWGGNTDEADRSPNRRVRVMLDDTILTPVIMEAATPEATAPVIENGIKLVPVEDVKPEPRSQFPWKIILILILIAVIAAVIIMASKRKKSSAPETAEPVPVPPPASPLPPEETIEPVVVPAVIPAAVPAPAPPPVPPPPAEKVKILDEEEIRRYAYGLYERRNGQNGDATGDWYQSMRELIAYYEAQGYRVILAWEQANT